MSTTGHCTQFDGLDLSGTNDSFHYNILEAKLSYKLNRCKRKSWSTQSKAADRSSRHSCVTRIMAAAISISDLTRRSLQIICVKTSIHSVFHYSALRMASVSWHYSIVNCRLKYSRWGEDPRAHPPPPPLRTSLIPTHVCLHLTQANPSSTRGMVSL